MEFTEKELRSFEPLYQPGMSMVEFISACGHEDSPEWIKNRLKARWRTLRNRHNQRVFQNSHVEVKFHLTETEARKIVPVANRHNLSMGLYAKKIVLGSRDDHADSHLPMTDVEATLRQTVSVLREAERSATGATLFLITRQKEVLTNLLSEITQKCA